MILMFVSVLTQHNDNGRSGANLNETLLTPDNVNVNQFGKLFECPVEGQIYAQPLYVPNVRVTEAQGPVRTHNVVYVATMKNVLYAFDADNGAKLWERHIDGKQPVPSRFYDPLYQDISDDAGTDNQRFIGILSTPVIDAQIDPSGAVPTTGTLYLTLFTSDLTVFNNKTIHTDGFQFHQLLYAIDLGTGMKITLSGGKPNPREIGTLGTGDVVGKGYLAKPHGANDPTRIQTSPDGTVSIGGRPDSDRLISLVDASGKNQVGVFIADGFTKNGADNVRFNPMQHMQRPALLLHQGKIIVCFGSHGDFRPYHGWVFAFDAATLEPCGVLCTSPNGAEAGVWQAGEGPVVDAQGDILVGTGNGDTTTQTSAVGLNLGESFLRLGFDPAGVLIFKGFFNPFVDRELNPGSPNSSPVADDDLGAASPTLLPGGMAVGGGKDGRFYLMDPSQFTTQPSTGANNPALLQSFDASFGPGTPTPQKFDKPPTHHIHGSPVVYNSAEQGILVYVWGENDVVRAYRYNPTSLSFPGQPSQPSANPTVPTARGDVYASSQILERSGMPGGILSLSASAPAGGGAAANGILWGSYPPFLDANRNVVGGALVAYDAARWDNSNNNQAPRIVAIWTSLQNPQRDRIHRATAGVANDVTQPTQFAKFCAPTIAAGKVYLATFNRPRGAMYVYGHLPSNAGGYNIGFGGVNGLTLNGDAQVIAGQGTAGGNAIALTAGQHLFQKSSVFASARQDVTKFHTTFEVTLSSDGPGLQMADGFTFIVQGQSPHALGGPGAGLGFGPDAIDGNNPGFAIQNSVAVRFGLFQNGQPVSLTGVYTRGEFPSGGPTEQMTLGADLRAGNRLRVTVRYDGASLFWTITDTVTQQVFTAQPVVTPLNMITGDQAFVGFTAATGGFTVTTKLHTWQFTPGQA
jgi:hypothetical protein